MAYDITCLSETRRNSSFCSKVTDSATKDHQEMPIYEVIAENTSNSQGTSEVSAHWSHGKTDSVALKKYGVNTDSVTLKKNTA